MEPDLMNLHCWHFHHSVYPGTLFRLTKYNGNNNIIVCSRSNCFTGISNFINYLHNIIYNTHRAWINTIFCPTTVTILYLFYDYILYNIFNVFRLLGFLQYFVMRYLLCTLLSVTGNYLHTITMWMVIWNWRRSCSGKCWIFFFI